MPDWAFILVSYLLGGFLMLIGLLSYLKAKEFRPSPGSAAVIGFIAGAWVTGVFLGGFVFWGGVR
jgi:apolipoprotein N-acyltransferase